MPRTPSGGYDLPAGQPVAPKTLIESGVHNRFAADVAQTLEDSLSRTGKGGMLVPFRVADGSALEPAYSFTNSLTTGMYLSSSNIELEFTVNRSNILSLSETQVYIHGMAEAETVRATSVAPISESSTTHAFQTGAQEGNRIAIDTKRIQSLSGGTPATLDLNPLGGEVLINGLKPAPDQDVYRKSEYIEVSLGLQSHGKPIVLDGTGKIHPTMADMSPFYLVDGWTPSPGAEYPYVTNEKPGAFWLIEGLSSQYTFTVGDLAGETCDNGYFMFYGSSGWVLSYSDVQPSAYYKLDGSNPIIADFQAGGYKLVNLADGVAASDAVTVGQIGSLQKFYLRDGTLPLTGHMDADGHLLRSVAPGADGLDAVNLNQLEERLKKDGTEKMTGSLTIGNGGTGFACYIRGNVNNDPRLRFKRTDDTNAGGLRYDSATNSVGVELIDAAGTSEQCLLLLDGTDNTLKFNGSKVFTEADHIEISAGSGDAGKPILLNSLGQIDPSMIDASTFYFVGEFTPTAGDEYPDETGETPGAFWVVTGLGTGVDYTFAGGDLTGRTVADGDFLVWSTGGWAIMAGEMSPTLYYRLDGSQPLTANFEAGGHTLTNVADGVNSSDAATVNQLSGYLPTGGKAADSQLLDGIDSANFVRKDVTGTQVISGGLSITVDEYAHIYLYSNDAPADEKRWMVGGINGEFRINSDTDDGSSGVTALKFTRTGTAIDSCTIGCDTTIQGYLSTPEDISINSDASSTFQVKDLTGVLRGLFGCTETGNNDSVLRAYLNDGSGAVAGELMIDGDSGMANFSKGINVEGNINVNTNVNAVGSVNGSSFSTVGNVDCGTVTAVGDITAFSDERVKENLEVIPDALEKVGNINGYTFDRTDIEVSRQTGLIAQELIEVLPEAVTELDNGMLTVAYGNVVGLLVEAIKELKAEVDELKGK